MTTPRGLRFIIRVLSCLYLTGGLIAAEVVGGRAATEAEESVRLAYQRLVEAGNYSWDAGEFLRSDRTPSSRDRAMAGQAQIGGFAVWVPVSREGVKIATLGDEAVYKIKGEWQFLERDQRPAVGGQPDPNIRRPLPHAVLGLFLSRATNFRVKGNEIVADIASQGQAGTNGGYANYLRTGRPPGNPRSERETAPKVELRVSLNRSQIVSFAVDLDAAATRGQVFFWELHGVGLTEPKLEPGVDVMLKTVQGVPRPRISR